MIEIDDWKDMRKQIFRVVNRFENREQLAKTLVFVQRLEDECDIAAIVRDTVSQNQIGLKERKKYVEVGYR